MYVHVCVCIRVLAWFLGTEWFSNFSFIHEPYINTTYRDYRNFLQSVYTYICLSDRCIRCILV